MSDFNAKMHQNRFWLGLSPRPPSWNKEDLLLREEEGAGKGKGRRGMEK